MKIDYRNQSRRHLLSAKNELGGGSNDRLKFAALELRMAMESLTYDRAQAYENELPPSEYDVWQPTKLMAVLLEIEPTADKDSSIAVGIEETPGKPASKMHFFGTEKVLGMSVLKKHYDALGSFLHVPTARQMRKDNPVDFDSLRNRLNVIVEYLEQVLNSRVWNATIGNFATMNCEKCGKPVRKRLPVGQKEVKADCFECKASYTITDEGGGTVTWRSLTQEIKCQNPNCDGKVTMWDRDLVVGHEWTCEVCQGRHALCLGIVFEAYSPPTNA